MFSMPAVVTRLLACPSRCTVSVWSDKWELLGEGLTDSDGRVAGLAPDRLAAGVHRLEFDTGG